MIITIVKHARTARDANALRRHVFKSEDNDYVDVAEIGNSLASDVQGVLDDALAYRDGAFPRSPAAFHITLNPARMCSRKTFLEAAHLARLELDPEDSRPYAIVVHGKARASGSGYLHGHLILGRYFEGRALKENYSAIRLEKVSRLSERLILHEPAVLGRNHASVVRHLKKSDPETAAWLIEAHGESPEKPQTSYSSRTRSLAKRRGLNLPRARTQLKRLWETAGELPAFERAISRKGFIIEKGEKPGVLVVRHVESNLVLGSVDRLVKVNRRTIMEMFEHARRRADRFDESASRKEDLRADTEDPSRRARAEASAGIAARAAGGVRHGPDQIDHQSFGANSSEPAKPELSHRKSNRATRSYSTYHHRQGLKVLRHLDLTALSKLSSSLSRNTRARPRRGVRHDDYLVRKDIWGIAILPKPRV